MRARLSTWQPASPAALPAITRLAGLAAPAAVIAVAAYLRFYRLGDGGLGNAFYAAAVRSMRHSLHNFVFAAYDPMATFSVDKPPAALWLQTLSTFVFGYGGFALTLPQASAGVAAVALLILIVTKLHGRQEALIAGLVLAVLPASVLVSRNNTMDTIVMASSLAALALFVRAASSGRLWPVALAGVVTGIAFNTKGFEAFVAMPGVVGYFLLAAPGPLTRLVKPLALFCAVVAVVGLSWVTAVSLVPASERPLVLNSDGNSELNLTFRYNGLDRILGGEGLQPGNSLTANTPGTIPVGVFYGGGPGPLRVFGEFPGPLIAAALPAALAGAAILALNLADRRKRAVSVLWLLWLACGLVVFSTSRLGSAHYFESFSPALAACMAVAVTGPASSRLLVRLPALAGIAGSAVYALERLTELSGAGGAIEALALLALVLCGTVVVLTLLPRLPKPWALALAPGACVIAVLLAMSYEAVREAPAEGVQPGAVFMTLDGSRDVRYDPASPAYSYITGRYDYLASTIRYLEARRQPGQYLAGVRTFYMASSFIAQKDVALLPLYSEFRERPELPVDDLRRLIDEKRVEYLLVSQGALRLFYPEAAGVIQQRCRADVSRAAGLAAQTGLQLLHCQ